MSAPSARPVLSVLTRGRRQPIFSPPLGESDTVKARPARAAAMDVAAAVLQVDRVPLAVSFALHVAFGGLLTGAVLFVAYAVEPVAYAGDMGPDPLATAAGKLATVSRASAVVLFVTGSHQAAARYTLDSLLETGRGHLVLAMLALWVALTALVEVAVAKLESGTGQGKVRSPARDARPYLRLAALLAVLVLVDGGLLAAGVDY